MEFLWVARSAVCTVCRGTRSPKPTFLRDFSLSGFGGASLYSLSFVSPLHREMKATERSCWDCLSVHSNVCWVASREPRLSFVVYSTRTSRQKRIHKALRYSNRVKLSTKKFVKAIVNSELKASYEKSRVGTSPYIWASSFFEPRSLSSIELAYFILEHFRA